MLEVLVEILLETSPNKRNMLSELAMLQATSKILSGRNPVTVIWNITATNSRLKSHYESSLNICFNFNLSSIFGSNFFFGKKRKYFTFPFHHLFFFFLSLFFFFKPSKLPTSKVPIQEKSKCLFLYKAQQNHCFGSNFDFKKGTCTKRSPQK